MSTPSHRTYGGAHAVAGVFKIASFLVIIGGVVALANVGSNQSYIGDKGPVVAGIIAGTMFTSAAVAFFAYVLDLLIGIERNTSSGPSARTVETPSPQPIAPTASPLVPAFGKPGWYSDPQRVARVRYWDGQVWTDQMQA
jgi:hypothetical protein